MNESQIVQTFSGMSTAENSESLPFASPAVIEDGARFSNMVSEGGVTSIEAVDPMLSVSSATKPSGSAMGEMLVAKLDAVGSEFKANMVRAHEEMNKAPDQVSLQDILKLEYEFAVISLQIDVVGKGVQKAVQNFDTLVKMQ